MLRSFVVVPLLVLASVGATPLDTVYDFLRSVEYGNLEWLLELLSEDLAAQLQGGCEQIISLAEAEPAMVERMMTALGMPLRTADVAAMDSRELLGAFLQRIPDLPEVYVERESLEMSGRKASVTLTTTYGTTVYFELVWENGGWRITWTSLLEDLFEAI